MATFNVNGFVFKKRKKPSSSNQHGSNGVEAGVGNAPVQKVSKTRISADLPAYLGTICKPTVRGQRIQDKTKPATYEEEAERLIKLFENVVKEETRELDKVYSKNGSFKYFNELTTEACKEFTARTRSILMASAKNMEARRKMNAPVLKTLPANEHLRAREAVLGSLIEKFEREK